jgi:hypothetical protein
MLKSTILFKEKNVDQKIINGCAVGACHGICMGAY